MEGFIIDLKRKAEELLKNNVVLGKSLKAPNMEYVYIAPSNKTYPHQWLWDSCFHIIVNTYLDLDLAKQEFKTLLNAQESNGFIPHMIYWKKKLNSVDKCFKKYYAFEYKSSITQTPLIAYALERIADKDAEFLKNYIDNVSKFYDYLYESRRVEKDNCPLLNIIHCWESGINNSPIYDKALNIKNGSSKLVFQWIKALIKQLEILNQCNWEIDRILTQDYFLYKDLLFNCVYIQNCRSLSILYENLGLKDKSNKYKKRAISLEKLIINCCWNKDQGLFFGRYGRKNEQVKIKTPFSLIPLILDNLPQERASKLVYDHLLNEEEFWTQYPIPSVAIDEESYNDKETGLLWRGPSWINVNWFIIVGLKKHGFDNIANNLATKTIELVNLSGFREYYNPTTGEGMGANNFAWSTLILDFLRIFNDEDLDFIINRDWTRIKKTPGF